MSNVVFNKFTTEYECKFSHQSDGKIKHKNIVAPVTVNRDLSVLQVPGLCQNAIFVCGLKIVILLSLHK